MIPIVGVDPSVTSTGIAWPDGTTTTIRPPAGARGGERLDWIRDRLERGLRTHPPAPRAAIIEAPIHAFGKGGPVAMLRLGEARGVLLQVLGRWGITVVEVAPTRLKRWATGSGRADKDRMRDALPAGVSLRMDSDDEVDAWWARHLGDAGINGAPLESDHRHAARLDVLASIDWPVLR